MKGTSKSDDLTLNALFKQLVLPILQPVAALDARRSNCTHSAIDALKMGFAIFHLKAPSLNNFRPRLAREEENLKAVFDLTKIPSDNGLRAILDELPAATLNDGFKQVLPFVEGQGKLNGFKFWEDHLICSIDGVVHQCSKKVQCPNCLVRKHRGGSQSYAHSMLSAAVVSPKKREVFIVNNEPIVKQDGAKKNDCERNAAKRLFARMDDVFASRPVVYVMDALYGCAPLVEQVEGLQGGGKYIINAKEKGNKHLYAQFDQRNEANEITWRDYVAGEGKYTFGFTNELELNATNPGIKTNFLYCRFKPKKSKEIIFSWLTNIKLTTQSIRPVMRMARSRWKIENEVFNTLKNQEYNYGHNFGHGKKHLATNFAYLMMLAFTVDQIRQCCSRAFQRVVTKLKTKIKVWDVCRSIFQTTSCQDIANFEGNLFVICGLRAP